MGKNLELRLAVPTTIAISLLLVISIISDAWLQARQAEETLTEQAYILSQEMQSMWDFISVNQELINTDGDGTYTFKGLHCSIVGTSVGALFSHRTDYVIRYVSDNPRNPKNAPDAFETEAIGEFRSNTNLGEYYSFGTMNDESYYRYSVPLKMQSACAECHGDPVGEIDRNWLSQGGPSVRRPRWELPAYPFLPSLTKTIFSSRSFCAASFPSPCLPPACSLSGS